jgi:endonuclease/exonuclease/phosphatase (EEP) superfamily protein YafD
VDCRSLSTIEVVAAKVEYGRFTAVVVVFYRPGSVAIQPEFYNELASVLENVAAYQVPVYIVGDFNVRLDRSDDPQVRQFSDLIESFGFAVQPTAATHRLGGTIDAVIARADTAGPAVRVVDADLSDHRLLEWSSKLRAYNDLLMSILLDRGARWI